jgi:hypothetical protein
LSYRLEGDDFVFGDEVHCRHHRLGAERRYHNGIRPGSNTGSMRNIKKDASCFSNASTSGP